MKQASKSSFTQVMSRISRVMSWMTVMFGLALICFGVFFWKVNGGQDIGGVVGLFCIVAGLLLAILVFPEPRSK